ncbi:MAG: DUF3972 domain-containing protein [Campylobacterales bacterium]
MQTWLTLEEFGKLVQKSAEEIEALCASGELAHKIENGVIYIEATDGAKVLLPTVGGGAVLDEMPVTTNFVEKTIGTILTLHERVMDAKDETLEALRNENKFLKEALLSMQELYEEERHLVAELTKQLEIVRTELELQKRKYRLMWEKAVENHTR